LISNTHDSERMLLRVDFDLYDVELL
jgi:hypothetical protein